MSHDTEYGMTIRDAAFEAVSGALAEERDSLTTALAASKAERLKTLEENVEDLIAANIDFRDMRNAFWAMRDERDRLEADCAVYRAALEPFVDAYNEGHDDDIISDDVADIWESSVAMALTVGDFRRARQALSALDGGRLMSDPIYDSKAHNDGLEAAALYLDAVADNLESMAQGMCITRSYREHAAAIRALKALDKKGDKT